MLLNHFKTCNVTVTLATNQPRLVRRRKTDNYKKNYQINIRQANNKEICNFRSFTVHLDIIKAFYSPTDAQVNCLKNNIKI